MADTAFDDWVGAAVPATVAGAVRSRRGRPGRGLPRRPGGCGPALELGIGTGRVALPPSRRGVAVHGVDLSPAMITQLRTEPGAYLLRNTITTLTTQDEQVDCFRNVAAHLEPGGLFVIENYIPELRRLPPGETIHVFTRTPTHLAFEEYDVAAQVAVSHHYWVIDGQLKTFSSPHRYLWPAELDLMARLAGMTLRERRSDWRRTPFTGDSRHHISFWERHGEPARSTS